MNVYRHALIFSRVGTAAFLFGGVLAILYLVSMKEKSKPLLFVLVAVLPSLCGGLLEQMIHPQCEKCGSRMKRVGRRTYAWRCLRCGDYIDTKVRTGLGRSNTPWVPRGD